MRVSVTMVAMLLSTVACAAQERLLFARPMSDLEPLSVAELVRELDSPAYDTAARAAAVLGSRGVGAAAAVRSLGDHVRSDQSIIRVDALEALTAIGRPALPELLDILLIYTASDIQYVTIAERGITAMGRDVVPDLLSAIVAKAKAPSPDADADRMDLRSVVIGPFQAFGLAAQPPLLAALTDPDPWVRGEAAYWLAEVTGSSQAAAPALERALATTPEPHRALIQKTLDRMRR